MYQRSANISTRGKSNKINVPFKTNFDGYRVTRVIRNFNCRNLEALAVSCGSYADDLSRTSKRVECSNIVDVAFFFSFPINFPSLSLSLTENIIHRANNFFFLTNRKQWFEGTPFREDERNLNGPLMG